MCYSPTTNQFNYLKKNLNNLLHYITDNMEQPNKLIGRVYELYVDGIDDTYIGSTTTSFPQRIAGHKSQYKSFSAGKTDCHWCSSFNLFVLAEDNPIQIRCLEEVPIDHVYDPVLRQAEQKWISESQFCVNKHKAFLTVDELAESQRQNAKKYYHDNIDVERQKRLNHYYKTIDARRAYYQANKQKIAEKQKNSKNPSRSKEQAKIYNKVYKEKHKERLSELIDCACGKQVRGISLKTHLMSSYHAKHSPINYDD